MRGYASPTVGMTQQQNKNNKADNPSGSWCMSPKVTVGGKAKARFRQSSTRITPVDYWKAYGSVVLKVLSVQLGSKNHGCDDYERLC